VASVRERPDRKGWLVDYFDNTGKRRRVAARTEEEAHILLGKLLGEKREKGPSAPVNDDITVGQYSELWQRRLAANVAAETLAPSTEKNYRWALANHILPVFKHRRLRDLQPGDISTFVLDKQAELSRATALQLRATLSVMLASAVEHGGIIKANVAKLITVRQPRGKKSQEVEDERVLDESEIADLIAAAAGTQERALLLTLARTGMRPGEAMGLKWTDVNYSKRTIHIERGIHDGIEGPTKTGKKRYVDMSPQLAEALRELYVEREKQKLASQWRELPEWIFIRPNGEPLTINNTAGIFTRACRRAGISGHTEYDLRHTYSSLLLAKGGEGVLAYVSKQLGHANIVTTMRYYLHFMPTANQGRVDVLDTSVAPEIGTIHENVAYLQRKTGEMKLWDHNYHMTDGDARSLSAAATLSRAGFDRVFVLRGGMEKWNKAGYAVERS
jgi:integrase